MNDLSHATRMRQPTSPPGWQATLELRVEARAGRSVLAHNRHSGPLRVQKALYPEGEAVCQLLLLHPPAGIAGGDQLRIALEVRSGAHAQLTTPGAGKWYRSNGPLATQDISLRLGPHAVLEWLPQEAIVFDQAQAQASITLSLAEGARAIGWDIVSLGRTASGERFEHGSLRQRIRLERPDGRALWRESLHLAGGDRALHSPAALAGHTVFGTLWIAGMAPDPALTDALRGLSVAGGHCGVTALPDVTLLRVLAHSTEAARHCFESAWALARQALLQRAAVLPRIWRT